MICKFCLWIVVVVHLFDIVRLVCYHYITLWRKPHNQHTYLVPEKTILGRIAKLDYQIVIYCCDGEHVRC